MKAHENMKTKMFSSPRLCHSAPNLPAPAKDARLMWKKRLRIDVSDLKKKSSPCEDSCALSVFSKIALTLF